MSLSLEVFFSNLSPLLIKYVSDAEDFSPVKQNSPTDYSTQIDENVEKMIIEHLTKYFPGDKILAEETSKNTKIDFSRTWIIDPICGTRNLGRQINSFCTNIALAKNGAIIASCVIDYSQNNFYWSVGDNKIYQNEKVFTPLPSTKYIKIDFDLGALIDEPKDLIKSAMRSLEKIRLEDRVDTGSINSSLNLLYIALGKIDGTICYQANPWDMAASSFLIQQTGGVATDIEGKSWTLSSESIVAARNQETHTRLINYLD